MTLEIMTHFFTGKLLIRLDDACLTNKKDVWARLEHSLEDYSIKPIISVIPNCKDPNLSCSNRDDLFWERIRKYQNSGYSIGMHGYEHILSTSTTGLLPLNKVSEFAGVPLDIQIEKIKKAYSVMLSNGVKPVIWVAPAHTFDRNTLRALFEETDIRIISDGIAFFPFNSDGFLWIPQQLWNFRKMPFGIWTICIHPDRMTEKDCSLFGKNIKTYCNYLISLDDILSIKDITSRQKNWLDSSFQKIYFLRRRIKKS